MKYQSERDRVELRICEKKLREVTKARDNIKQDLTDTIQLLNTKEEELTQLKNRYDALKE